MEINIYKELFKNVKNFKLAMRSRLMKELISFEPIVDKNSKILILGSMPGKMSLNKVEYYGNPRNHFWKIIFDLFDADFEHHYDKKIEFIKNKGIALWDVIEKCEREGSLDVNIKNEKSNDITSLLEKNPNIKAIAFNGGKAFDSFRKSIGFNKFPNLDYIKLPSTSPIPGKNIRTYEEKLKVWEVIKKYLN
ncbi:DNA-deoxyinosine glycosylase [Acetoanaerobium pronyense]|nr:DNA-deoxyinosine glycosylase [Acetoanaerobium pronyense]